MEGTLASTPGALLAGMTPIAGARLTVSPPRIPSTLP